MRRAPQKLAIIWENGEKSFLDRLLIINKQLKMDDFVALES